MNSRDAILNHEWVWDNLPQEVQDALNDDWALMRGMIDLAKKNVSEGDDALAEALLEIAEKTGWFETNER